MARGLRPRRTVIVCLNGLTLLSVGVLGRYVGRILDEVRKRPLYAVDPVGSFDFSAVDRLEKTPAPRLAHERQTTADDILNCVD